MANADQVAMLKRSVAEWNEWREKLHDVKPDLREADLSGADLSGADFSHADLSGADVSRASLKRANLFSAHLIGASLWEADVSEARLAEADLSHADLRSTNFWKANLNGSNLREANLELANLTRSDLSGAQLFGADFRHSDFTAANLSGAALIRPNLTGATLRDTVLANVNLGNAIGLRRCIHNGPSIIDHRTFAKSGSLSPAFLRGCGLSEWQIEATKLYGPTLTPEEIAEIVTAVHELRADLPIQVTNLFISYSHKDGEFVDHIQKHLDKKGVRHWRDKHDAPAGPMESIIIRAISDATVLLVLSKSSVQSDWVRFEVEKARELEKKSGRHILCPIALDDDWKTCKWPERLRLQVMNYNVVDFSGWQSDDFKKQFERLLSGLKLFYPDSV